MAVTTSPLSSGLASNIVRDTDSNETAENDVRGGAATLYLVKVDNTDNAAVTYTKLYNSAAPTVGTTAPDVILMTPASSVREFWFGPTGVSFGTGISVASVTAAGTAGTTGPTSDVEVNLYTS